MLFRTVLCLNPCARDFLDRSEVVGDRLKPLPEPQCCLLPDPKHGTGRGLNFQRIRNPDQERRTKRQSFFFGLWLLLKAQSLLNTANNRLSRVRRPFSLSNKLSSKNIPIPVPCGLRAYHRQILLSCLGLQCFRRSVANTLLYLLQRLCNLLKPLSLKLDPVNLRIRSHTLNPAHSWHNIVTIVPSPC